MTPKYPLKMFLTMIKKFTILFNEINMKPLQQCWKYVFPGPKSISLIGIFNQLKLHAQPGSILSQQFSP